MKKSRRFGLFVAIIFGSSLTAFGQHFAVVSGDWNGPIWASSAAGLAGSAGIPTLADSIMVSAGVVITVRQEDAQCSSIAFADAAAKLALDTGSVLTVYGNFTLASTTHTAFSAWGPGAKIVFAGDKVQLMKGWSTTAFSTSFNYIQVNKTGGKVVTEGTNMRFGVGDTLELVNGTFELATTDDIESRSFSGSATSFVLLVRAGGTFTMVGSTSHIRRASNTSLEAKRVSKAVIYGTANMRSTSTNGLNFGGIDIEPGGELVAASFSNSAVGNFNSGPVTVKPGGELRVVSSAPFWEPATASVNLHDGGTFRINGDPANAFPGTFINNGTVRYGSSNDQTVRDMNYHRLEISFGGIKTWTVDTNRTIADSLEINNGATLQFAALSPKTVTVNGTIRLTSGTINNSDSGNVTIVLSDTAAISRATGVLTEPVQFGSGVTLRYTSSVQTVTPGAEMPQDPATLKKLIVAAPMGISLSSPVTVNEELSLTEGNVYLNNEILTLASSAVLTGAPSESSMVVQTGNGTFRKKISAIGAYDFPVGDTLSGRRYTPARIQFVSGTFSGASVDLSVTAEKHPNNTSTENYLNRYWTVASTGISGFSADVAFTYDTSDVVGFESGIVLGQWIGSGWGPAQTAADSSAHRLTGTVSSFSDFTGGELSGVTAVDAESSLPRVFALRQNFPNPFNPATVIRYELPVPSIVTLKVFDLIGKETAVLVNREQSAGMYQVDFDAVRLGLASGIYFYRMEANSTSGNFVKVMKMMLVK